MSDSFCVDVCAGFTQDVQDKARSGKEAESEPASASVGSSTNGKSYQVICVYMAMNLPFFGGRKHIFTRDSA